MAKKKLVKVYVTPGTESDKETEKVKIPTDADVTKAMRAVFKKYKKTLEYLKDK